MSCVKCLTKLNHPIIAVAVRIDGLILVTLYQVQLTNMATGSLFSNPKLLKIEYLF